MHITRSAAVVATVISSALLLIAGTQPWLVLGLSSDESSANELVVTGATLAPSFVGLTLAYAAALIVALVSRFVVRIASAAIAMAAAGRNQMPGGNQPGSCDPALDERPGEITGGVAVDIHIASVAHGCEAVVQQG
jgi:hypothetical protein